MKHDSPRDASYALLVARMEVLERRVRHAQFWRAATLLLVAGSVLVPLIAAALDPVPYEFADGDPILAGSINRNFAFLRDAIQALEGNAPPTNCAANQIPRFDGDRWVCGNDATLAAGDDIEVSGGRVSLSDVIDITSATATYLDMRVNTQWNNSNSNGVPEMNVFTHSSCAEGTRGRLRFWRHEDIGNSTDLADALCFCQQYVDRTPDPDVTTYRWVCIYPRTDGN